MKQNVKKFPKRIFFEIAQPETDKLIKENLMSNVGKVLYVILQ